MDTKSKDLLELKVGDLIWKAAHWGVILDTDREPHNDFVAIFHDGIKLLGRGEFADEDGAKQYYSKEFGGTAPDPMSAIESAIKFEFKSAMIYGPK